MKRMIRLSAMLVIAVLLLVGCGANTNKVVGTWYSDQDDASVLMLKKDNTYTDGSWLTSGDFSVEEDTLVMVGALDGTNILKIQSESGETVLCYYSNDGTLLRTYYDSAEKAASVREARKEAERIAAEEKAAAELKALRESIIGYWCNNAYAMSFTEDGEYTEYTVDGPQKGTYEILEAENEYAKNRISVTKSDGTTSTLSPIKQEDGTFIIPGSKKAEPVALSEELLTGAWYNPSFGEKPSWEFFSDGTFAIKSALPEYVPDIVLSYSISGENTFVNANSDTRWAYLSKNDTEYQLYWSLTQTTLGESFTSLNYLVRPIEQ